MGTATNVTITDQIPNGTEYAYDTSLTPIPQCSYNDGVTYGDYDEGKGSTGLSHIRWIFATIGPGQGGEIKFKVRVK